MSASAIYNPDFAPEEAANDISKLEPQNIDAEKSVLAACMLDSEAALEVVSVLQPAHFYRMAHQLIFASIKDLTERNIPVDHISLADNLKAAGNLTAAGGKVYLVELADNTYALTNWRNHTEIVKRTSILRDLIRAASQIRALAYEAPDNLSEVVEEAEKTLFKVTEQRVSSDFESINDLVQKAYADVVALNNSSNKITGVATGFKDIDALFHGLRGGDLIILAARPGVGKTAFALNVATNAARLGTTVAFLSLEMSSDQLVQRLMCSEARVSLSNLRSGNLRPADLNSITGACAELSRLPLFIDDTPALSILELRAKARRELRDVSKGLIVVDYLQLMQSPANRRESSREREVAEISRGLKVLAKEMNMPVLALSQLSRKVEDRSSKRPILSDLRESGAIEQDADIVMFIDRSMDEVEAEAKGRPPLGRVDLIVAKHRNGPTKDISLAFNVEHTRFADYIDESRVAGY